MPMTRHEEIAEILLDEILRGQYRAGERLPSERDLAGRFEVNRGSVREAIKKLEQLGLADVQPGGARVRPVEEANLDVIGALLALDEVPDPELMEQMLEMMGTLMRLAAKRAVERASDEELAHARKLLLDISRKGMSQEEAAQARLELGRHFMTLSGNLVLRLISNSLRVQVMGRQDGPPPIITINRPREDALHRQLDDALATRSTDAVVSVLEQLMALNTEQIVATLRTMRGEQRVTARS